MENQQEVAQIVHLEWREGGVVMKIDDIIVWKRFPRGWLYNESGRGRPQLTKGQ